MRVFSGSAASQRLVLVKIDLSIGRISIYSSIE
jgi:hypothetical protein